MSNLAKSKTAFTGFTEGRYEECPVIEDFKLCDKVLFIDKTESEKTIKYGKIVGILKGERLKSIGFLSDTPNARIHSHMVTPVESYSIYANFQGEMCYKENIYPVFRNLDEVKAYLAEEEIKKYVIVE